MKNTIILTSLFFITSFLYGQPPAKNYIEVIGSAEADITPNIIVTSIRLKEYEENKSKVPLEEIEKTFNEALAKSNIDQKNIEISNLNASMNFQKRKSSELYSQKTYQITFSNTKDVLILLKNLKNVNIEKFDIVKLSHTEIEKYRLDLKIAALKAAESKAGALLNSVGSKRGKPLFINENPDKPDWSLRPVTSNTTYDFVDKHELSEDEITFKKINLRFEILAQFEIE